MICNISLILPCVEYIEGPKNDLFPEILRDEAVARIYELGKVNVFKSDLSSLL